MTNQLEQACAQYGDHAERNTMPEAVTNCAYVWDTYAYYELYKREFSCDECDKIIGMHRDHDLVFGRIPSGTGLVRNSDLFWIPCNIKTQWIFSRLSKVIEQYNARYGFQLAPDIGQAQLTRYRPGQHYDWHMDLGPNQSSLRKITVVVELTSQAQIEGGGLEVFYGESQDNRLALDIGDVAVFPSFVMHRASIVNSGVRWSLVLWLNGLTPLK